MRGSMRRVGVFVALVWIVNFAVCSSTKGLVPSTVASITDATDQLGEWRFLGDAVVYFADAMLAAAALGFYVPAWVSWVRNLPAAPAEPGGSEVGRAAAVQIVIAAQMRVFIHLALVFFAVGNFPPLGWVSLAIQGVAAASVMMAMFVLRRAARIAGPPHTDVWIVAALVLAMSAATAVYVVLQARGAG